MGLSATVPARPLRPAFSLAGTLDGVAFALLSALASFLFFSSRIQSPWVAALPAALFTGCAVFTYVQVRQRRLRLRRKAIQRQAYDLWLCDEMVKSEEKRFSKFAMSILLFQCQYHYVPDSDGQRVAKEGRPALCALLRRHPSAPVTAQDLLDWADKARGEGLNRLVLATTAPISDAARQLAVSLNGMECDLYDGAALCSMAWDGALTPAPGALEPYYDRARELLRAKKRSRRIRISSWGASLRFTLTAVMLALLGWITPFKTWYMVCAALCLLLAAGALLLPLLRKPKQLA